MCLNFYVDAILQSEIEKRDAEIEALKEKYSAETKIRVKAEKTRNSLAERLVSNCWPQMHVQ